MEKIKGKDHNNRFFNYLHLWFADGVSAIADQESFT
jgi:hypothetical protein